MREFAVRPLAGVHTGETLVHVRRTPWEIQKTVVFALLMREIKTRFGTHWTGVIWVIGGPLWQIAFMLTMNVLMRGGLTRGSFDYELFLVATYVPFWLSMGLWSQLSGGIGANRGLFNYRQVKPFDTIIARTILESVISLFAFILALLILERVGLIHEFIPAHPLDYLMAVLALTLFGMGMGLLLATIVGLVPRVVALFQALNFPFFLISGVMLSVHTLPLSVIDWLLYNPLLHLVELARAAYLPGYVVLQGVNWLYPVEATLIVWSIGMALYRLRRRHMAAGN